ncbi:uncharacterized protein LOC120152800 [Hibiscus syriacus]|uniref:uncharacterized protein LOC120152800 n=1 Tax=Hibiscus syriacus TaxID=106335 RepID=UPI001921276A|nr:uncharacterized protein LOC120152800 [Hibiscus syriacus]
MHPEDMEKTTFVTMWYTFCFKVMPFGIKIVGATYQRVMILLSEFDFHYVSQKAVKRSAIADFIVSRASEEYEPLNFNFPDEDLMAISAEEAVCSTYEHWKLNFDGVSNALGHGILAILVSPSIGHYPFTSRLNSDCTNNMIEYEACILGLIAAIERKVKTLKVYMDSALVIYQLRCEWKMKDPKLVEYRKLVLDMIKELEEVTFHYLPIEENQMEDALATLVETFKVNEYSNMMTFEKQAYEYPTHCYSIEKEDDGNLWYYYILQYIKYQSYPE